MNAARMLRAAIDRTAQKGCRPKPITSEFAQAIAKRLESREIVRFPGLPADEPAEWFDMAIEHHRHMQQFEAEREAGRQAEEQAQEPPRSTMSIIAGEIARAATGSGSAAIPLNGAAVLRTALSGGHGTVNGASA